MALVWLSVLVFGFMSFTSYRGVALPILVAYLIQLNFDMSIYAATSLDVVTVIAIFNHAKADSQIYLLTLSVFVSFILMYDVEFSTNLVYGSYEMLVYVVMSLQMLVSLFFGVKGYGLLGLSNFVRQVPYFYRCSY